MSEAMTIYKTKVKPKKPVFTLQKRPTVYGSGKFDLRNVYIKQLQDVQEKPKLVLFKDENNPIQGQANFDEDEYVELDNISKETMSRMNDCNEEIDDNEELYENLSDSSLPTHISEIEETQPLNIKEFVESVREKYKQLNSPGKDEHIPPAANSLHQYLKQKKKRQEDAKI